MHSDAAAGTVPVERKKKEKPFKCLQLCRNTLMLCLSQIKYSTMRFHRPQTPAEQQQPDGESKVIILIIHQGSSDISASAYKIISAEALGSGNIIFQLSSYRKIPQTEATNKQSQLDSRATVKWIRVPFF